MKKLINIAFITLGFSAFSFAQTTLNKSAQPEKLEKTESQKEVKKQEVSAEKKYKLARTRMMRDPISQNLYNEKFRRYNGYQYNNRPQNHKYIR